MESSNLLETIVHLNYHDWKKTKNKKKLLNTPRVLTNVGWRLDASYSGSLLWQNYVFSLGTFHSNAYGD
jgi:hypothetical protein